MHRWYIRYGITTLVGLLITFLAVWAWGLFSVTDANQAYLHLSNGFFLSSVLLLSVGFMTAISASGFFDVLYYGFHLMRRLTFRFRLTKEDYAHDLVAYREMRFQNRRAHWFIVIVGAVFLAVSLVFNFLFVPV